MKFTERGEVNVKVRWIDNQQSITDECFEPIPYTDEDEGLFEKNEFVENLVGRSINRNSISYSKFHAWDLNGIEYEDSERDINLERSGILKIIVSDTGCGMSTDGISKLFVKFS